MRKYLLPLLIFCMVIVCAPFAVTAEEAEPNCIIRGNEVVASPDSDVTMTLTIENNPGISGAEIIVSFDERLTLVSAEAGEAFSTLTYVAPSYYRNPTIFMWDSEKINDEDIKDGIILELTFHTPKEMEGEFPVTITYESGNIFDKDLNPMELTTINGCITAISYLPGDADGNGRLNTLDITAIRRYISDGRKTDPNGYNVVINENAADVDGNGRINTLDITMIRRYISDGRKTDPNGYNIVLKPGKMSCEHDLTATTAKAPTCSEPGNIAYWHCSKCNKYFSDAEAKYETTLANTILNATGHTYASTWSYDEYSHWYNPTCEHLSIIKDYAEHSFVDHICSVCTFKETLTVTFVDYNDMILDEQEIEYGADAISPPYPQRNNYRFIGWNKDFNSVTENLVVKAQYIHQYTVTFLDYDGRELSVQMVDSGTNATAPNLPQRNGYTFKEWDTSFENVVSNLTVTAQYTINTYSVTFKMPDGTVIKYIDQYGREQSTQYVEYGSFAIEPEIPTYYFYWDKDGKKVYKAYGFTEWSCDFNYITSDTEVIAKYSTDYNYPIIALKYFDDSGQLSPSLTLCNLSNYKLYAFNFTLSYATDDVAYGFAVKNVNINSAANWLFASNGDQLYDLSINNKTKQMNFAWSYGNGITFKTYGDFISSMTVDATGGAEGETHEFFLIKECSMIISSDDGVTFRKVIPIVIYE